jgi:predicted AAA+ superfamily ATPase
VVGNKPELNKKLILKRELICEQMILGHYESFSITEKIQKLDTPEQKKDQSLYAEYLRFGGIPEVVLAPTVEDKIEYLKDLINAYIARYKTII